MVLICKRVQFGLFCYQSLLMFFSKVFKFNHYLIDFLQLPLFTINCKSVNNDFGLVDLFERIRFTYTLIFFLIQLLLDLLISRVESFNLKFQFCHFLLNHYSAVLNGLLEHQHFSL